MPAPNLERSTVWQQFIGLGALFYLCILYIPIRGTLGIIIWIPAVAFALFKLAKAYRGARDRRLATRAHLCKNCGYDLRATPERCPECGLTSSPLTREVRS